MSERAEDEGVGQVLQHIEGELSLLARLADGEGAERRQADLPQAALPHDAQSQSIDEATPDFGRRSADSEPGLSVVPGR